MSDLLLRSKIVMGTDRGSLIYHTCAILRIGNLGIGVSGFSELCRDVVRLYSLRQPRSYFLVGPPYSASLLPFARQSMA
jgi:hypothetical protein